ncbi:MAG: aminoacetone oxidase family FAD-binding enzyme [Magnetococcales bacterium]|nr:aminoacetone oxidase family FAD-binding enzyme [Magnetococcales bacterium]|tara:strand:+ start:2485 stop:3672 length:1188 start_codon:yes stop_codon:yes gene_type:complete
MNTFHTDVLVLGAGGAGLMCAIEAGKKGRKVTVLDHAEKVGKKILISGGGRCNFTNVGASADRYQSGNRHFMKSAFGRYSPHDFIALVENYQIAYHEKKLGQQFCDKSAQQIVDMLLNECAENGAEIRLKTEILNVSKKGDMFHVATNKGTFIAPKAVVATGGLSIPKMGATNFGHKLAEQFNIEVTDLTPALVPFTFSTKDLERYTDLSGISIDADVACGKKSFRENILITHRGVSGPAILQISSYWKPGQEITIRMLPDLNWSAHLKEKRQQTPKTELKTILSDLLPKRFAQRVIEWGDIENKPMAGLSDREIHRIEQYFTQFKIKPNGTEGYRKAEVTLGGVSTKELDAKTLESKKVPGLHFIGEVVDVTGWLGGYNFQWAWASGFACGQSL